MSGLMCIRPRPPADLPDARHRERSGASAVPCVLEPSGAPSAGSRDSDVEQLRVGKIEFPVAESLPRPGVTTRGLSVFFVDAGDGGPR
jgi:hypothetical protein